MTLEPFVVSILNYALATLVCGGVVFILLVMVYIVGRIIVRTVAAVRDRIDASEGVQFEQSMVTAMKEIQDGRFGGQMMDPVRRKNLANMLEARQKRLAGRMPIATTEEKNEEEE